MLEYTLNTAYFLLNLQGTAVVALKGQSVVVIGVERRAVPKLQVSSAAHAYENSSMYLAATSITSPARMPRPNSQDPSTLRKILAVDEHITLAFAGLAADARVLINKARLEAQSHRLTVEDEPSVEYMARFIARTQQRYTQRGGVRPFGICTIMAGHDVTGVPQLYVTDPAGTYAAWKANAIGHNDKSLREYLESHYSDGMDEEAAIKLVVETLMEVVEPSSKSMAITVCRAGKKSEELDSDTIMAVAKAIEEERAEAAEGGPAASAAAPST